MASTAPALMRIDDAALMLSVCKRTIFELIASGTLPAFKIRGATIIRRTDIDKYVASLPRVRARFAA